MLILWEKKKFFITGIFWNSRISIIKLYIACRRCPFVVAHSSLELEIMSRAPYTMWTSHRNFVDKIRQPRWRRLFYGCQWAKVKIQHSMRVIGVLWAREMLDYMIFIGFPDIVSAYETPCQFNNCSVSLELQENQRTSNQSVDNTLLFVGYSTTLLRLAALCCLLFMIVGILGNLITIIALLGCKKVSTEWILWFFLYLFNGLGTRACQNLFERGRGYEKYMN